MTDNYKNRIAYRNGNVIGLNFASPRYEIEEYQRRSEGCEKTNYDNVISLDKYREEKSTNNIYVKATSLEDALKEIPLEQRRSRKGKNAQKLIKGLTQKISKPSTSNVVNLLKRRTKNVREAELLKELNEARNLGVFEGFLDKRSILDYLTRQLLENYGHDLNPLSHLYKKELTTLGLSLKYYHSGSLESRIEGGVN